ncbi:hypothetical protein OUZ56_021350 [Daphnia magna]|uniref:Fibroblast growth factor n=1 Tax=Daphnia magna TaxID=35525 RepID=A0ABQ9ZIJ5_9CRUS|nr:hypothetical protein OUZ56_021350 [Daphnia magna]
MRELPRLQQLKKTGTVLKQNAVGFGRIYIRGIASRLYLCINECGRLYGSVNKPVWSVAQSRSRSYLRCWTGLHPLAFSGDFLSFFFLVGRGRGTARKRPNDAVKQLAKINAAAGESFAHIPSLDLLKKTS